jgi:hypothetical protein
MRGSLRERFAPASDRHRRAGRLADSASVVALPPAKEGGALAGSLNTKRLLFFAIRTRRSADLWTSLASKGIKPIDVLFGPDPKIDFLVRYPDNYLLSTWIKVRPLRG